jgi:hypothetical protein
VTVADASTVDAACRGLLGVRPVDSYALASAPKSAVHRATLPHHRTVIVKLWGGSARWKADKERLALTALSGGAFRGPPVLGCGHLPGRDVAALILDDVGPRTLGQAARTGAFTRADVLGFLGRLLNAFHTQPPPGPGLLIGAADLARQVDDLRRHLPQPLVDAAREPLDQAAALTPGRPAVWCHGDLHAENVLLRTTPGDTTPYVIDFEQCVFAPAEYDIAQTLVTTDALTPEERAQVAAAYGGRLSQPLVSHLVAFHALRGWRWAALHENRDAALWQARLQLALQTNTGPL